MQNMSNVSARVLNLAFAFADAVADAEAVVVLLCWLFALPLGRVGKLSVSSGAAAPPDEAEGRQNLPCASNLL